MIPKAIVFAAISSERHYQDKKWGRTQSSQRHAVPAGSPMTRTLDEYALYILEYAEQLRHLAGTSDNPYPKLDAVRKVTALGVACMEEHGAPLREGEEIQIPVDTIGRTAADVDAELRAQEDGIPITDDEGLPKPTNVIGPLKWDKERGGFSAKEAVSCCGFPVVSAGGAPCAQPAGHLNPCKAAEPARQCSGTVHCLPQDCGPDCDELPRPCVLDEGHAGRCEEGAEAEPAIEVRRPRCDKAVLVGRVVLPCCLAADHDGPCTDQTILGKISESAPKRCNTRFNGWEEPCDKEAGHSGLCREGRTP
jgi:hypothetical protein